ncbi:MAG TPA: hypothetical protein VF891_09585 [Gaiellaceae bacterium]
MSPDERRRYKAQRAEWARNRAEFEAMYERLKTRWREEDERRERRRRLLRRLFPFRRPV